MKNTTVPQPLFHRVMAALLFTAACAGSRSEARPARATLAPELEARGDTIYFGSVYPLAGEGDRPTYVYERRVERRGSEVYATHITRSPDGGVELADSALHSGTYGLREYTLHANQLGQTGSIRVEGQQVRYEVRDADGVRERVEETSDPVVVGPTLVGYIVQHLPELRSGRPLVVRMAILDRLETIGFQLEGAPSASTGLTSVRMKPTSFLIGLVVDPITFHFDAATRRLVRLEGRVPPKVWADGWKDFDARVEYQFVAEQYL